MAVNGVSEVVHRKEESREFCLDVFSLLDLGTECKRKTYEVGCYRNGDETEG